MTEQLVSFETAKLAKEKGVDFNVEKIYNQNGILVTVFADKSFVENNNWYLAPTQSLLQKWLREIHNIHVYARLGEGDVYYTFYFKNGDESSVNELWDFDTYENALEEGLKEGLKIIK